MYDCHYDLLTCIYINRNDLREVKTYCDKIFQNNVEGGIFNLFYMSKQEMQEELEIKPKEIDIIENLKTVKYLIKKENLIPEKIKYKIGIEGLDYLKSLDDIEKLYNLGVRAVNPVWNNHNQFGTGVRPNTIKNKKQGLTKLGEKLIIKLIKTGIAIDVSHSDDKTFWDIIEQCSKYKKFKPKILASHSNCRKIYDVPRNLSDEQIKEISKFQGIIGIVEIKQFCTEKTNYTQKYIEHIKHIKQLLGGVNNIALATDDMSYYKTNSTYYKSLNIFKQEKVSNNITKLLEQNNFSKNEIYKIKKDNFIQLLEQ